MASTHKTLATLETQIIACRKCPRLVEHREEVGRVKRRAYLDLEYWAKPVPGFGESGAKIVIIGLAPGAHGSNRTGRMFTGDASGDFLFPALKRAGLASREHATDRQDGMKLRHCYITAAVRCAPPSNRPLAIEKSNCRPYLAEELVLLRCAKVYLCLGQIAFEETSRIWNGPTGRFAHGAVLEHDGKHLISSYHVSRQNTQTGRLTTEMFDSILTTAKNLAGC